MQASTQLPSRPSLHSQRYRPRVRTGASTTALTLANPRAGTKKLAPGPKDLKALEKQVLDALASVKGRGKAGLSEEQLASLNAAVAALEADGGVRNPTADPDLDGRWRLMFTSRPGSASPIQNAFTGVESFSVYQEVLLTEEEPRVNNVVVFGTWGELKVEAQASTEGRPLDGFTPRRDSGEFLFGLFGRSVSYDPARPNSRIDFQFDQAAFAFSFLPFKIPYPVPFRILGDERKGWIDVTYMSADHTLRLSRGNKQTLFILVKDVPIKDQLKKAIAAGDDDKILSLVEMLSGDDAGTPKPARSASAAGKWRLVWSQQAPNASPLQKFGSKQANSFQIIDASSGTLQNVVDMGGVRIMASADCSAASDTRTTVQVNETYLLLGQGLLPQPVKVNLPTPTPENGNPGFVDWLYLDDDMRVTRGSKGSLFIHYREADV